MKKSRLRGVSVFIGLFLVLSCESSGSRSATNNQESQTATPDQNRLTDESLMALVKRYAAGVENEPGVSEELARYPRTEIIDRLRRLQDTPAVNDGDKIAIAFLLCNLDYEVEHNKRLIAGAFTKEPHRQNRYADWESDLIGRLIEKGHKDLLPTLLSSAEWADGGMAESLSIFLAEQVRTEPKEFALQLSKQPPSVRRSVYVSLQRSDLTKTELDHFRKYLNLISPGAVTN